MIFRSSALSALIVTGGALLCLLGDFPAFGAEKPAATDPPVDKELATSAAPLVDSLDLTAARKQRLLRDFQALHAGAKGAVWPAELTTQVSSAEGLKAVAEMLGSHGFLPPELAWLEKVPHDPPDLHTSIVVLHARQLLQDGPANFDGLWPKWNDGDTPGTAPNAAKAERADLATHAANAKGDVVKVLNAFVPKSLVYELLQKHFAATAGTIEKLRADFIPIPEIKEGSAIKPGDPYMGAPILAQRLAEEGYLTPSQPAAAEPSAAPTRSPEEKADEKKPEPRAAGPIYTVEMSEAVKRFQEHHGRTADGIVGPNTLAELNRDPDDQLALLRINLHRSRLLPDELGERHVMVNIPSAQVLVFAGAEKPEVMMKAIVGAEVKDRQTPVFRDVMERVEFGPYWNVPPSIAKKEILPKVRKDRSYLERNKYEIVTAYEGGKAQAVNDGTLSQVESGKMFIRQKPGPKNALGRVKFLFPNDFSIYLHDTPDDQLFVEAERGFSHGCIRVEDPAALAEFVLGTQGWDRARVETALQTTEMQKVVIENPLNLYIVYFTAFPDWDSSDPRPVRFHPDIYERDKALLASVEKKSAKDVAPAKPE
jgi:murein L,D-transpeptidase YcbB/YkuD